jgi:hypothetical protein
MRLHNFQPLYEQYPLIIERMPTKFTAHQFILRLAQVNQVGYINALEAYTNQRRSGQPAPFQMVHGILAKRLHAFPNLIRYQGTENESSDIFGNSQVCSSWEKVVSLP